MLAEDGVVLLKGALSEDEVRAVEDVYDHGRAHPSPGAYRVYPETGATFYIDTFNAASNRHMLAINVAMGYRAVDSWMQWQQTV